MIAACAAVAALAACSAAVPASWDDPTPRARLEAIRACEREGTVNRHLPQLVQNLWSDDAVVRMAAIDALRRGTGEDLGYRFDDPPADRAAAIARWEARASADR
jgi:hypothetical protein